MVSWGIYGHADLRQLIKSSSKDGLVGFFRSARSRMAHRFFNRVFQRRCSFPLWNAGNNPWSRMLMYFSALTFMSQTISSEHPAVQMAPQTITEKPSNLTVGCRCCKENSWDGRPPDPNSTAVRKLCKLGLIREDNGIQKLQRLAYHLWPLLLSALNVERVKKWLPPSSSTAIPKGTEIADNSSWVLLNHFGHISCSYWRIVFNRSLDSTKSPLRCLWTTWARCFPCLSWIAPTLGSLWRVEVLRSRGLPLT